MGGGGGVERRHLVSVYAVINLTNCVRSFLGFKTVGCYKDIISNRAIPTLEGTDPILDGSYDKRKDPIEKCAVAAMKKGFSMFVVQNGGWCASGANAQNTFALYGESTACKGDGEGGPMANQVYHFLRRCS